MSAAADEPGRGSLPPLKLWQWLQLVEEARRSRDTPFLVGGSGHLLLSAHEEDRVTHALTDEVLPEVIRLSRGRRLVLLCGLAPGADLLFQRVALAWLRERDVPHDAIGLMPVPAAQLAEDWGERANRDGYTVSSRDLARLRSEIETAQAACSGRVQLFDTEDSRAFGSRSFRESQYRRLGALLALHADALIAVLRYGDPEAPGGTAEVVSWRRDPRRIPAEFRPEKPAPHTLSTGTLFVINPELGLRDEKASHSVSSDLAQPTVDEEERIARIAEEALAAGNDLLCNDLVFRAFQRGLGSPRLAYLRVQSLANVGSHVLARRQYDELAPPPGERDARWLTLLGRLEKDLGLRDGKPVRAHLLAAAQSYLAAYALQAQSYPAINAATLLVLAGEPEPGRTWARTALHLVQEKRTDDDGERYFLSATAAEACLILGDVRAAATHLIETDRWLPQDFARRNRSLRQLRRICAALNLDASVLAALRLPPLIFLRRTDAPLKGPLENFEPPAIDLPADASVFASLCDAFDLCVLETVMARRHPVYLSLAFSANTVIEETHQRLGASWGQRLESCLAGAQRVSVNRGFLDREEGWSAALAIRRAFGLSLLAAARSGGDYRMLEIRREDRRAQVSTQPELPDNGERLSAAIRQFGEDSPSTLVPAGRRMVGLVFADIAGFMRLDDPQLPPFWATIMQGVATIMDRYGQRVLLRQTWGDALHAVTTDARTAAEVACAVQALIYELVAEADSPFPSLEVRVAAHYAPAFEGHDPIQNARTYFGTQLTFTARIEPVTPPGQLYVTEALAAQLTLEAPGEFASEYVGEIELAKRFGTYRVYAMSRL